MVKVKLGTSGKGKKVISGRYERVGNSKLVSNEWYAHTALDEAMGGEKEFQDLTFNLLVTGELEIVTSEHIGDKERNTRLQVLKKLAYSREFLPLPDILNQYACFISKIEKGKYRWGSKSAMALLD